MGTTKKKIVKVDEEAEARINLAYAAAAGLIPKNDPRLKGLGKTENPKASKKK